MDKKKPNEGTQIQIFPVEVEVISPLGTFKEKAYKINHTGMIIEVNESSYLTQMHVHLKWNVPMENVAMDNEGIVVKTYNQHRGTKMQYLIEVHFKKLKLNESHVVKNFVEKVEILHRQAHDKAKGKIDS